MENVAPKDTNARNQRDSRPVSIFTCGNTIWDRVLGGEITSCNLDDRLNAAKSADLVIQAQKHLLPFQRQTLIQQPSSPSPPKLRKRQTLGDISNGILTGEIEQLEYCNAHMKITIDLQAAVINDFCALYAQQNLDK